MKIDPRNLMIFLEIFVELFGLIIAIVEQIKNRR